MKRQAKDNVNSSLMHNRQASNSNENGRKQVVDAKEQVNQSGIAMSNQGDIY